MFGRQMPSVCKNAGLFCLQNRCFCFHIHLFCRQKDVAWIQVILFWIHANLFGIHIRWLCKQNFYFLMASEPALHTHQSVLDARLLFWIQRIGYCLQRVFSCKLMSAVCIRKHGVFKHFQQISKPGKQVCCYFTSDTFEAKVSKSFCRDASRVAGNFRLKSAGTADKSKLPKAFGTHAFTSFLLRSRRLAGLHKIKPKTLCVFHQRTKEFNAEFQLTHMSRGAWPGKTRRR